MKTTIQMYCQYLLNSQNNYTCTNLSNSIDKLDENSVYRFLINNKLTPKSVREKAWQDVIWSSNGYVLFDDSVLDKNYSSKIEGVKLQYSGNAHGLIKGICLLSCIYYNEDEDKFWLIDYRIYDPEVDGKDKLQHMEEMLDMLAFYQTPYSTVLMDTWYATMNMIQKIHSLGKYFYCPIKANRLVDDSGGINKYTNIDKLTWSKEELETGKLVKLHKSQKDFKVKLFKVVSNKDIEEVEFVITNNLTQHSANDTKTKTAIRWKIEQFHREIKQNTGIQSCQCRKRRSQRNHIACALMVWVFLKKTAYSTLHSLQAIPQTVYQLKQAPLKEYLTQQMLKPSLVYC